MAKNNKWTIALAFTAIYIVWGSTYLGILFGLRGFPPFMLATFRFIVAGIGLTIWRLSKGEVKPDWQSIQRNSVTGTLLLVGGVVSVTWAEQYLASSVAAIIVSALPFWFVVLDKSQWSYYFSNKSILAGLIVGFMGVIVLVSEGHIATSSAGDSIQKTLSPFIILIGGVAWASGSLFSRYKPTKNSTIMNAGIQFLIAGTITLIISLASGEWNGFHFAQVSTEAWVALAYLIVMGSLVTYLAYLWLLKVRPPAQVSTYVYVNPVVALFLGIVMARESISWMQTLALAIILCGVLMVNLPKYKKTQAAL
ncbi:MAG: EamA family transporter [Bacteroidetes bacterium]|nr:MAG: EamA family transporter [Bacteroidota bacterium]